MEFMWPELSVEFKRPETAVDFMQPEISAGFTRVDQDCSAQWWQCSCRSVSLTRPRWIGHNTLNGWGIF